MGRLGEIEVHALTLRYEGVAEVSWRFPVRIAVLFIGIAS
jgi:hypothetical protein